MIDGRTERPVPLPVVSESGGGPTSPGWYTDPARRFEYRYHNGVVWTSDVASNGQRYVDPLAPGVAHPPFDVHVGDDTRSNSGNGIAIAAMVCGTVSVVLGWIPVVFAIAVVLAVLAIIFGIVGVRRARESGRRRGFAIAGLVTGAFGIPVAVVGLLFTIAVFEAFDRYENPPESTSSIESCEVEAGRARAEGELRNEGNRASRFTVYVTFRSMPSGFTIERITTVPSTPPGRTTRFAVNQFLSAEFVECEITGVYGPLPFGIELD
jgi:hypothetical protein